MALSGTTVLRVLKEDLGLISLKIKNRSQFTYAFNRPKTEIPRYVEPIGGKMRHEIFGWKKKLS